MSARRLTSSLSLALLVLALAGIPMKSASPALDSSQDENLVAGRNVNMVSGTRLPWGDPWLQRQNEPSLAASSRNPMHLLAGANDYRTIDMPDNYKVPGIPPQAAARDAWLGLFKSFDGGQSWITTLLPGYPQDTSSTSPIHGFDAACDPSVRAGSNGMFYYSGIAFNRAGGASAVFLARLIDNNNLEEIKFDEILDNNGQWNHRVPTDDPIKYVDTRVVDTGNSGQFIDMPTVAVDIPRSGLAGTSTISGQSIPNANVYLAYTVFLGNFDVNVRSRLMLVRSTNCGQTWSKPIKLSESQHIIQRPIIAIDPIDPAGNTIYVAFRRFAHGTTPGGIVICKSYDGGQTFTKPIEVETLLYPFDQAQAGSRFRTNSYPTMAVDGNGIVHIAWAQRMNGLTSQSRIVIKTSSDGVVWSEAARYVETVDEKFNPLEGNQFMPTLTFAGGRLLLAWFDQRDTLSSDKASGNVTDVYPNRQTIDVRAAEAILIPGSIPVFSRSYQVSRYLFFLELDANGEPIEEGSYFRAIQAEYNPPNLPLFQLGTRPFLGDYIDLAPAPFILPPPVANGSWAYNILPFGHPVTFHSAWTDNRDVRPPADGWWGDWVTYAPPNSDQDALFDQQNPCGNPNGTGMRNQNVYTANIGKGVFVGSPGNTKQLNIAENLDGGRRTFVVVVKNSTEFDKEFDVALDGIGGDIASFTQTDETDSLHIAVAAYSSYSCTVFVDDASGQILPVKVNVYEDDLLVGYALLNPDATNLPVSDPDIPSSDLGYEKHNPRVMNPRVWNYDLGNENEPNPRVMNPRVMNPRVMNPRVMNPRVMNPRVMNPRVMNPRVMNDSIVSYEVANPRVMNPRVMNTALTDVTWLVSNEGNTTSAYKFDIVSTYDQYFSGTEALIGQVLVYKAHLTPAGYQCGLYEVQDDELLVNITNPRVMNNVPDEGQGSTTQATSQTTNGEAPQDVTFYLAPGEEAYITFRVWDDDTTDDISFNTQTVAAYVEAEAINTGDTAPSYALPEGGVPWENPLPQVGTYPPSLTFYAVPGALPANQTLTIWNAGGGTLEYTLSKDVSWLIVSPEGGTSTSPSDQKGHVVAVNNASLPIGTYQGFITVNDPDAANNPFKLPVTLTVSTTPPPPSVEEWVTRYNGPANGIDWVRALALDGAGNVYVAGETTESAGNHDFVTIKYDPSGNELWRRLYNGPGNGNDMPNAIAVDPAGNVAVAGESRGAGGDQDYATVKYDSAGIRLWAARYEGFAAGFDSVYYVTMDTSGNVYVTGFANGAGGKNDIATIKYASATGAEDWRAIYNGAANDYDVGFEVEVDLSGNVYVSGESGGTGTNADCITLKYNNSGTLQWEARYDGPGHARDVANELAVDAAGNVYIGANSEGDGTGNDYATIKYDSSGTQLWVQRYTGAGTGSDSVQELVLGPDGSAYVTGGSQRPGGTLSDIKTIRYNSAGEEVWEAKYSGSSNGDNVAFEMALAPSGAQYVTGESSGGGGSQEFVTIKYGVSGGEDWVRRYHGPGSGNDISHEVALDAAGNIYIGGLSYGDGTDADMATIKYRPELEDWHAEYDGPANRDDDPVAVAVDDSGYVYVTGSSVNSSGNSDYLTIKYDPAGVKLWETRYDGPGNGDDVPEAIAVDSAGNVYVTGSSVGISTGRDYATIMYDSAGNAIWAGTAVRYNRDTVNGEDMAHAIAVDSAGIYVTGRSFNGTDFDWLTIKYNSTGTIAWTTAYDNGGGDWPFAMAVDEVGDVYVAGESVIVSGGEPTVDTEMTTVKYSGSDGSQLAYDRYSDTLWPGVTDISQATDIAIRSDLGGGTAIVVTGLSNGYEAGSNFVTIRYNASLVRQWTKTYNGPGGSDDMPVGVEIDPEGNVYVTGDSYGGTTTNRDFATIKYDPAGGQVWVRRFNGTASFDDSPAAIALDVSGNAYVTGWSTGANLKTEFATVKYDSSGVERWLTTFRGVLLGDDKAKAVAVDAEGNVCVTGQSQIKVIGPITPHFNIVTFKYRKEGF